ncbi:hypothetical protein GCM10027426_10970 [Microbacterium lacusdiani]
MRSDPALVARVRACETAGMTARLALRTLAPIVLAGSLLIAGCSAGGEEEAPEGATPPAESSAPAETPADEAPSGEVVDEAVLEGYVVAAGLEPIDIEAMGGVEGLSGLFADAEIEPAECAAAVESGLAIAETSESSMAVGVDEATGQSGGVVSFAEASIADGAVESGLSNIDGCGEITITMADGTSVTSTISEVPVSIDGADSAYGVQTDSVIEGTGAMSSVTVTALVDSLVVTGSAIGGAEAASGAEDVAQRLVDAIAAG